MKGIKKGNDYQGAYPSYDATPKAVIAAVAFSLAMRLSEDNEEEARSLLRGEWAVLHNADIVAQRPQK